MRLTLNIVCFILGLAWYSAQKTFKVYGVVNDFHNKTALKNAKIKMGNRSTLSDEQGKFTILSIPKGEYDLRASHPDCEDFVQRINLDKDIYLHINVSIWGKIPRL